MAELSPEEILGYIKQVGLAPTKAKNLSTMALQILDAGGEIIPTGIFWSHRGVGHKVAGVVMAQSSACRRFPSTPTSTDSPTAGGCPTARRSAHRARSQSSVSEDTWNRRHLQIIFFGREYCPARNHDLATCDICSWAATKKQIALEAKATPKKRSAAKMSTSRG